MKIGILTYHRSHNYGALLQLSALKRFLENEKHSVEVIDYWPDYHAQNYTLLPHFKSASLRTKLAVLIRFLFNVRILFIRRKCFLQYLNENLNLPLKPKYKLGDDLLQLNYDAVLYGSDQIWRKQNFPSYKGFNEIYFGSQINAEKKISYAASMGVLHKSYSDKNQIMKLLANFDAISVREDDLKEFIKPLTKKKVYQVLDPTFLLCKTDWEKLIPCKRLEEKPYLLYYKVMPSKFADQLVEKIAKEKKLKIIEIQNRVGVLSFGNRYKFQNATVSQFLSLINNAHFIVATSFHGVAFSIIFNKQFYATGMGNFTQRVVSLLSVLGIKSRMIDENSEFKGIDMINYESVNAILDEQIEYSKLFIINSLK